MKSKSNKLNTNLEQVLIRKHFHQRLTLLYGQYYLLQQQ